MDEGGRGEGVTVASLNVGLEEREDALGMCDADVDNIGTREIERHFVPSAPCGTCAAVKRPSGNLYMVRGSV